MNWNYTQEANHHCFDLVDADLAAVWQDIENTPEDTDLTRWKKKLELIAREYTFSSRFALMRILCSHANGTNVSEHDGSGFQCWLEDETVHFDDITMDHAENLSPAELLHYEKLLMQIALEHNGAEEDRLLLRKAWYDAASADAVDALALPEDVRSNQKLFKKAQKDIAKQNKLIFKSRLTREEAFRLGHLLGFSLEEMQWYLLRVFQTEDGFQYNVSGDLIEAYGFLTQADADTVAQLKDAYRAAAEGLPKKRVEERGDGWTMEAGDSLRRIAGDRLMHPDDGDSRFLQWMMARAPYLDLPSRTALRVFRNLTAYAYQLALDTEDAPIESDLVQCISEISELDQEDELTCRLLYEDGVISAKRCQLIAGELFRVNQLTALSELPDKARTWRPIMVRGDGKPVSTGGLYASRDRLQELLLGKHQVEKGDMLYLLWFIANQCWMWNSKPRNSEIYDRLADFIEAARICLDNALMPPFYPPHLMEQTMMLAIVCADAPDESPTELYEAMCRALILPRKRTKRLD